MLTIEQETEMIDEFKSGVVPIHEGDIVIRHVSQSICGNSPVNQFYVTQYGGLICRERVYPTLLFATDDKETAILYTGNPDVLSTKFCLIEMPFVGEVQYLDQEIPAPREPPMATMAHVVRVDILGIGNGAQIVNLPAYQRFNFEDQSTGFLIKVDNYHSVRPRPTT